VFVLHGLNDAVDLHAQSAAGLKESLSYYQDLVRTQAKSTCVLNHSALPWQLGWLSDLIEYIYELFQWKNPIVTKTVRLAVWPRLVSDSRPLAAL
jgi:hypothetical protein